MKNYSLRCAAISNLRVLFIPGVLAVCAIPYAMAQSAEKTPPNFQNEGVVIEHYDTLYRYNDDGTGVKQVSVKVKLQSEAGMRQFSVLSFPFAAAVESAHLDRLVVRHPDGTSSETPSTDAMEMPAPVTQQAPLYSDLKLLQVPVRGLRSGDEMEYVIHMDRKNPEAPGQFWGNETFLKGVVVLNETVTLDVPAGKYVQEWSGSVKPAITKSNGRQIYVWTTSQLEPTNAKPKSDDDAAAKPKDEKPDIAWTTFHSWAEVGAWYRALAAPRAVPTDALKAQAAEITRDAGTPEQQAQAIYRYVSTRVHYVGIDFGIGRYQPHAAAEIFANQYGDCKDKDTLFEALLSAKGITSAPALIGVRLGLVKEVPSPAFFNHVITTVDLPGGAVWADTTPGLSPFQLLMPPIRDKAALVIPRSGDAHLGQTPARPPFPFVDRFEADGTLTAQGELTAEMKISYRSDTETYVRAIAQYLSPAQWDQGTQLISNASGFSGTTSQSSFSRADDFSSPMKVSYHYSKKPFGDWDNFRIVPLLPIVSLPMAPKKQPEDEIDLGAPRTESVISRIKLPAGFGADLPDAVHVKTPFATLDKTYKLQDGEFVVERQIVVLQSKLEPKLWEEYKQFTDKIALGNDPWIQLTATSSIGKGPQPPKPGENNPAAATLVYDANEMEKHGDFEGAMGKLDEAKKINAVQPYLWSNYGYIAAGRQQLDEAQKDYEKELSLYPKEGYVVRLYAALLYRKGDHDAAFAALRKLLDQDPSDVDTALMLGSMEGIKDPKAAIAVLQKAQQASPENKAVMGALADFLIRDHRDADAAKIAAKLLDGAGDDPNWLNSGAYLLAEAGGDLALAEKKSRESLQPLETQLAEAAVSEANQQSFARSSLVVASWDTLGYILWKEKKYDEALDYLEAAWRNSPRPEIAEHYADALKSSGRPEDLRTYALVKPPAPKPPTRQEAAVAAHFPPALLAKLGTPGRLNMDPRLLEQKERTFHLKLASACKSFKSATYRLQLSADGVHDVLHVTGASFPDSLTASIRSLHLPHLVPSRSKALLLRDAIFACSEDHSEGELVLVVVGGMAERTGN